MGVDNAVKSVINHYKWTPQTIAEMYCDDLDLLGIMYWYDEVKDIVKSMNKKK